MLGQLRPESPLDQGLLQLLEEALLSEQIFRFRIARKQLIKKLRRNRRFGRHASLLQKVNSQKPAYTSFRTPSIGDLPSRPRDRGELLFERDLNRVVTSKIRYFDR